MSGKDTTGRWFAPPQGHEDARLNLFCFPYAGGNHTMFRTWGQRLPPGVAVYAAQLPGRGARIREAPLTNLDAMVEAFASAIRPHLDRPYAFFGHSMGAMISYELARRLRREGEEGPAHLFVSGRRAPHVPNDSPPTYDLPEAEFVEDLRRLNGTPQEVLDHPELMQLIIPLLRADFSVCQTYDYVPGPPLACPITVFGGVEDETDHEQLEPWREHTSASFTLKMFPGGHFFIHRAEAQMLEIISEKLRPLAWSRSA